MPINRFFHLPIFSKNRPVLDKIRLKIMNFQEKSADLSMKSTEFWSFQILLFLLSYPVHFSLFFLNFIDFFLNFQKINWIFPPLPNFRTLTGSSAE
jgi:hypothetical protein